MNEVTYEQKTIRSAAILTNAYVAGTVITDLEQKNQMGLCVDFTIGSLTDLRVKVEYLVGNTYYQETFSAVSAGVSTDTLGEHKIAATGKYYIPIPIKCSAVKVSFKGTGTVDGSSVSAELVYGVS